MFGLTKWHLKFVCDGIVGVAVIYLALLFFSWRARPPFSNDFAFQYGFLPYVPGWSRIPTYITNESSGDVLYVDGAERGVVIVRDGSNPEHQVLGWPMREGHDTIFHFDKAAWIEVGDIRGRMAVLDIDHHVSFLPFNEGQAKSVLAQIKSGASATAVFKLLKVPATSPTARP